mgnify:CR=1 FL=1
MRGEDPEVETNRRNIVPDQLLEILLHNAFEVLPPGLLVFSRFPHSRVAHVLSWSEDHLKLCPYLLRI